MPLFYLPLFSVWRSSFFFLLSSFFFPLSSFNIHHSPHIIQQLNLKSAVPPARAVRSIFCLMLQQKDAAAIPTAPPFPLSTFHFRPSTFNFPLYGFPPPGRVLHNTAPGPGTRKDRKRAKIILESRAGKVCCPPPPRRLESLSCFPWKA